MKKIILGLFLFSFLFVGSQVYAEDTFVPSIPSVYSLTSSSITSNNITVPVPSVIQGNPTAILEKGMCYGITLSSTPSKTKGDECYTFSASQTLFSASNLLPNTTYKFRGYAVNATGAGYSPEATFTTLPSGLTPSITVLSPNGGEVYTAGQQITIKWKTENIGINGNFSINLHGAKNSYSLATYTANDGEEIVTLPSDLNSVGYLGNKFLISVGIKSFETPIDYSDDYFTIKSSSTDDTTPSLNVTGCISNSNFSITTGQACPKTLIEDDGCSAGAIYSSTTGNPCNTSAGPNNVYTSYSGQTLGTGSNTSSTVITRTLKIGIKGDDVKALQAFLNLLADGSFGPKTQAKVIEWQAAHGLTADGSFGPMSRQKAGLAQ